MMLATVCGVLAAVTLSLDGPWEFHRRSGEWRTVRVPHDWAIEGPFEPDGDENTGKLPWKDYGAYRRTFVATDAVFATIAAGGRAYLEFDGVMARSSVIVNGRRHPGWGYGYMSFAVDVTDDLASGTNAVTVTADTRDHESRWYPGGGLYRSVCLVVRGRDEPRPFTLFIRTPEVSADSSTVVYDYETVGGERKGGTFKVANPRLWSVEDPHLYELEIAGEKYRYGIRTIKWTADDGFHLNGRRLQLKGVNLHSDLGPLGMAFDRDAMKRQLLLMKDMGVNAIRTSHNAPDPRLLDLCDEMGFVVWDECFDKWDAHGGKRPEETVEDYVATNLEQFVRRDRNHPSVVLWSIGNEIYWKCDTYEEGTSAERSALFRETVRRLDPTRPVGMGCCHTQTVPRGDFDPLDVTGWNYDARYLPMRARKPEQPLVYSESASALSDYGYYPVPFAANEANARTFNYDVRNWKVDGYDHFAATWSDIPDVEFDRMEKDRYIAGEFVWTGVDYLGEPTPYASYFHKGRPRREMSRSSYFGIADLCAIPKDRWYLYRAYWNQRAETVHILPHWNWEGHEGENVPVYVYTSGDSAELFLNGRSLGLRRKGAAPEHPACMTNAYYDVCAKYRLRWFDVPYAPGELRAVAYRDGRRIGEETVRTADRPVAVRLAADPWTPEDSQLLFVQVDVVDAKGVRDPKSTAEVSFALEGPGEIVAVGNGDPRSVRSFKDVKSHPLFFGKALVIVRRTGAGEIVLRGAVPGLADGIYRDTGRNR